MSQLNKRLGDLLLSYKLLSPEQLEHALEIQRDNFQPLGQILLQQNYLTEERLLQICALQKGVTAWHLQHNPPTPEALALVPAKLCRAHLMLPVQIKADRLLLAMRDTNDIDAIDLVRNVCRMRVEPVLAIEERLLQAIEAAHHQDDTAVETMNRLVSEAMTEHGADLLEMKSKESLVTEAEMRPVVGVVNQILMDAVRMHASDIHFEPRQNRMEVRYRIDGQMQRVHEIPAKLQAPVIARIKIMAHLDIVEYRVPQDGRISMPIEGQNIDMRVSVLPNYHGQRIVLRVLDKRMALRKLPELGFSEYNLGLFQEMIRKPHGLVLVTGPTGSGKTTTLYAALNQLKQVTNNIMTCEDPVEYDIDGINQSHVNEKVGLTFAAQLRSILRQDPDIVLVGEIRDKETAETAIRAALTGHLVFSTLHCNDAPSAIPRLRDMGIEPYLLSTALIGVTAQRLVRVLCPHCKEKFTPDAEARQALGLDAADTLLPTLWRPIGCKRCQQTGYKGRMGIHEIFPTPQEVQHAIAACDPLDTMRQIAARYGYLPMQDDARQRLFAGQTSLQEIRRQVFFEAKTLAPVLRIENAA